LEDGLLYYLMLLIIPFVGVVALTPLISRFAISRDIVDRPGLHKTHYLDKPLLGGMGIFIIFALTMLFLLPITTKLISLVLATVVLVATGLFDDIYNIKPLYKLAGQTAAASIVALGSDHRYAVLIDYFEQFKIPEFVVLIFIIGWIVMMINAFNLIDGLDGLAVGTAAIIFLAMAVLSLIVGGNTDILGVQMIGLGACLGFLLYNFNPARIFMGDTGSMLLGFILATTHLFVIKYPFSGQLVLGSIFIFAYPALDVSYAIFRRLANRSSILHADRGHIHHVLLSLGFSVRKTVLLIYLANIIFATIGVILLGLDLPARLILFIGIGLAVLVILFFSQLLKISRRNGLH